MLTVDALLGCHRSFAGGGTPPRVGPYLCPIPKVPSSVCRRWLPLRCGRWSDHRHKPYIRQRSLRIRPGLRRGGPGAPAGKLCSAARLGPEDSRCRDGVPVGGYLRRQVFVSGLLSEPG